VNFLLQTYSPIHLFIIFFVFFVGIGCSLEDKGIGIDNGFNDKPEGNSSDHYIFGDLSTYEGQLKYDLPNGYGVRRFSNGNVYKGQFRKGFAHGYGNLVYKKNPDLIEYTGGWKKGKKSGFGKLSLSNSSRLEGHWQNDFMVYGEYFSADGTRR